jgi:glutathione S-transferase
MKLHHWEPHGACARVLIALAEKGLPYAGQYVDLLNGEQFRSGFLALNPGGQVPVLEHDGLALTDASYICEYLEEAFPDAPRLMPDDPKGRWTVRGWQKFVDDHLAGAISDLAWDRHREAADPAAIAALAEQAPTDERRAHWREHAAPFPAERLDRARAYVHQAIERMEAALARGPWLAGDGFSLADIAVYGYASWLPDLAPELVSPPVADWLGRVGARDSVNAARQAGRAVDPHAQAAPGPEQTRWG